MVVLSSWADLGYGKVGPRNAGNPQETVSARLIATTFAQRVNFEMKDDTSGVWIRDPGRVKTLTVPDAARIEAVIDAAQSTLPASYSAAAALAASPYPQVPTSPPPSLAMLREKCGNFEANPRSAKGTYDLVYAVSSCSINELSDFLRNDVSHTFFQAFPVGRIVLLSTSYEYERRQGALRGGYTLSQYDIAGLGQVPDPNWLKALSDWQLFTLYIQLRSALDLGILALFPVLPYFSASRPGLTVIFVPGELIEQTQPDFPSSWLDIYRSRWDFAREPTAAPNVTAAGLTQPYTVQRRFLQAGGYAPDDVVDWLRWLIARFNELIMSSTDPTSFKPRDGVVDFVTCFEHGLSMDRLLRKSVSAQVSQEVAVRKYATFEVADIIDELAQYWAGSQQTERFKVLFNPTEGLARFTSALATAPNPIRSILLNGAASVYDDLRTTILDSVFVAAKRTSSGGVLVRDKTLSVEREEDKDTFTANVVRALRNTHHGYMTSGDKQSRPSRYLALVTGALPDTMTYIGVLSGLALLGNSTEMIGRPPYSKAAYD